MPSSSIRVYLGSRWNQGLAIVILSLASLGCTFFPAEYNVPFSFSVHVTNGRAPLVGLKLRITNFKSEEFSKLTSEQQRTANPDEFVELIAEALTDESGVAHFNLSRSGHFDLQPDHPASLRDWVVLNEAADAKDNMVKFQWPTSAILETKQLRGRISDGLMSPNSSPLKQESLSLHALVSFKEIATTRTNDDGSFQFGDVPQGVYFLHIGGEEANHGEIAVFVSGENTRDSLSISTTYTSCGLSYDLEENKSKYKREACFKGGVPVPCNY
jgi:hypothetical protein